MKKVMIVAAHPDDEVLGCGGTIARLVKEGYEAYTLILGEGVTSRDEKRDEKKRASELKKLKTLVGQANKCLGVREVFTFGLPDNRFDTVPLLDIVKIIESVKRKIDPQIIFTHYENDLNVDHRLTYRAVLTATRPLPEESVKEIYCFEIASSTEWNYPLSFSPAVYFDVSAYIDKKKKALAKYKSEVNDFPHPRSLEGVEHVARYWGMRTGVKYAEAFAPARIIK